MKSTSIHTASLTNLILFIKENVLYVEKNATSPEMSTIATVSITVIILFDLQQMHKTAKQSHTFLLLTI